MEKIKKEVEYQKKIAILACVLNLVVGLIFIVLFGAILKINVVAASLSLGLGIWYLLLSVGVMYGPSQTRTSMLLHKILENQEK